MLLLAEQHTASCRSSALPRLNHYTLVVREKLQLFEASCARTERVKKCESNNLKLLTQWKKWGFPEEAFGGHPDLVDFVLRVHLHRYIRHADYQHTIKMLPTFVRRGDAISVVSHPHLLVNGQMTPWSKIAQKIAVDEAGNLYSEEGNGKKLPWMYLDQGFVQKDRHDFEADPL